MPWQLACQRTGARLRWFGLTDEGRLDVSNIEELVTDRTKIVSIVHQSNILGTVNSVSPIVTRAREVGALVMLDCSQSVPHKPVDVTDLGVDLIAFTGHKMCGPTGIGVLWGRSEVLESLPPFLGGGEMIETVDMTGSTYAPIPHKFEAGTPPIAQAVGLGAAIDYLSALGMENVAAHERALTTYALHRLDEIEGCGSSARGCPSRAVEPCRSPSTVCIRTTSDNSSTSTGSLFGSAITARARYASGMEFLRPPERLSTCTRHSPRSTRWPTASSTRRGSFGDHRLALPGDHPGPLQAPGRARPS